MPDEQLLILQYVELIGVERAIYGIYERADLVIGIFFGYDIAFALCSSVALLQVGRSPRDVEVVYRYGSLLCIYSRTQFLRRAEQNAHLSCIHGIEYVFACFVGRCLLDETYLVSGYVVISDQFMFDFGVYVPLARFVSGQIAEYELCPFRLVVLSV